MTPPRLRPGAAPAAPSAASCRAPRLPRAHWQPAYSPAAASRLPRASLAGAERGLRARRRPRPSARRGTGASARRAHFRCWGRAGRRPGALEGLDTFVCGTARRDGLGAGVWGLRPAPATGAEEALPQPAISMPFVGGGWVRSWSRSRVRGMADSWRSFNR
ncbi:hypothetical protein DFH06DRAFT_61481 [Mycena polygramma]|nr:hypothetical protein DFH06DRAFT_686106 [Mycena polygramma]KAJ7673315.1 hypothetical protein DFH06DRAFT_61481 [Mycena polygramma]